MLLPLGQKGDPVAQEVMIGFMYMRGDGVPPDRAAAFHWLMLAAEAGRPDAGVPKVVGATVVEIAGAMVPFPDQMPETFTEATLAFLKREYPTKNARLVR